MAVWRAPDTGNPENSTGGAGHHIVCLSRMGEGAVLVSRLGQITRPGDQDHSVRGEICIHSHVTCGIVVPRERCVLKGAPAFLGEVRGP
jgi:hypothetical protein